MTEQEKIDCINFIKQNFTKVCKNCYDAENLKNLLKNNISKNNFIALDDVGVSLLINDLKYKDQNISYKTMLLLIYMHRYSSSHVYIFITKTNNIIVTFQLCRSEYLKILYNLTDPTDSIIFTEDIITTDISNYFNDKLCNCKFVDKSMEQYILKKDMIIYDEDLFTSEHRHMLYFLYLVDIYKMTRKFRSLDRMDHLYDKIGTPKVGTLLKHLCDMYNLISRSQLLNVIKIPDGLQIKNMRIITNSKRPEAVDISALKSDILKVLS